MALRPAAKALARPLADAPTSPVAAEFSSRKALPVAGAGPVTLDVGARVGVGVSHGGELLFPADDLRDAVTIASGTAYVSVGISGRLAGGGEAAAGPASFGVSGGASLATRYFHPFESGGSQSHAGRGAARDREARGDPARRRRPGVPAGRRLRVGGGRGHGAVHRLGGPRQRRQPAGHAGAARRRIREGERRRIGIRGRDLPGERCVRAARLARVAGRGATGLLSPHRQQPRDQCGGVGRRCRDDSGQ